ncbi:sigma-70 family RNA polymerase sigma factor [Bacillus sp. AG4(2022)]|uniref:sigma-70 family RNA polymerase sigma factor n=1 Tax=Bacillus sp. AG4(2022) TaxID=2962594 RepID=UPI00288104EA|nr:sigma-70 family RNA polymerase sigma factor [Bacillus sp. AG4(2022)]MDT0161425.1 sigma-70 family RNA polymerase sigma factor [Bacillus sp. AG4(2022)]
MVMKQEKSDRVQGLAEKADEVYPALQRYSRFLTQNSWDGDDLAQEAFLRAASSYEPERVSQALLKKIAYNCWVDVARKRKKEQLEEAPEPIRNEEKQYVSSEAVDKLMECLTLKQAVIYALKEGFQYTSKEIAGLLQTTEFAVKSALSRARRQLQTDADTGSPDTGSEEAAAVARLLARSLQEEDPGCLLRALPMLPSLKSLSVHAEPNPCQHRQTPPQCTLSIAA